MLAEIWRQTLRSASLQTTGSYSPPDQLAGRGTEERTPTWMISFWPEFFILKSMMFREVTTVLNE